MKKFISKLRSLIEPPPLPAARLPTNTETATKSALAPSLKTDTNTPKSPATASIEQHWETYKEWLNEHFTQSLGFLNSKVTEDHLAILEKSINNELPTDYRNWLKVHNGQTIGSAGLLYGNEFLSVSRLLEEWLTMKKLLNGGEFAEVKSNPNGTIRSVWWNINWLPISADGAGNLVCIDLAPTDKGVSGQIIDFDHETAHRQVLANSFKDYVAAYLNELEVKKYRYSDDIGTLVPLK